MTHHADVTTEERIERFGTLIAEADESECYDISCRILDFCRDLAAKLSAAEERDRWRTVERDGLPEQGASITFVLRSEAEHGERAYVMCRRFGPFKFGGFDASEVLCWRPARPVGELPGSAK